MTSWGAGLQCSSGLAVESACGLEPVVGLHQPVQNMRILSPTRDLPQATLCPLMSLFRGIRPCPSVPCSPLQQQSAVPGIAPSHDACASELTLTGMSDRNGPDMTLQWYILLRVLQHSAPAAAWRMSDRHGLTL